MNWHVGVKLRAESAGGPLDERRVGECCEWFGRITSRPSGPNSVIKLRAALNHRCCHHPRYLPPPPILSTDRCLFVGCSFFLSRVAS